VVPVNWLVLEELASRADNDEDPLDGMELYFDYAKSTVPEFRRFQSASVIPQS
jgi:hypothetical protein